LDVTATQFPPTTGDLIPADPMAAHTNAPPPRVARPDSRPAAMAVDAASAAGEKRANPVNHPPVPPVDGHGAHTIGITLGRLQDAAIGFITNIPVAGTDMPAPEATL
jgi:hypothetical protein